MSSNAFSNHFVGRYRISMLHINLVFIYTRTTFVSEILLVLRHSLVQFLPHLLLHKYHVISMKYFVDVTLFIPK